jgi:hypothetical protein
MNLDALLRAAQILRSHPARTMPLMRLHACLADELGSDAGTYAHVHAELKKRPHSFMVLEAPRLTADDASESVLEGAGVSGCTWVTLAEGPGEDLDALGVATATLTELWSRIDADPTLGEYLLHAAQQLEALGEALG